jgi:hypothetical protein
MKKTFLRFIAKIYFHYFGLLSPDYSQMLRSFLRSELLGLSSVLSREVHPVWIGKGQTGHRWVATPLLSYLRLVSVVSER